MNQYQTLARWKSSICALLIGATLLGACASDDSATTTNTTTGATEPAMAALAADTTTTPAATGTPDATATAEALINEHMGGGGGKNIVRVVNRSNGDLRVSGSVQLNQIPGPNVEPVNAAMAQGSCTNCQTFAVALQINLISRSANRVAPQNGATAVNIGCSRCYTVARALQYVISVDDPRQVPDEVNDLIKAMDKELNELKTAKGITVQQAEARINDVIGRFRSLASSLDDSRDQAVDDNTPGATPIATEGPTPTPESGTPTATPASDATATATPVANSTATPATEATASATPTDNTPTPTPEPPTAEPTTVPATAEPTVEPPTAAPTEEQATASPTPTETPSPEP